MIYAIFQYGFRKEALVVLDLYLFWQLQISVTQFADFSDSFQNTNTTSSDLNSFRTQWKQLANNDKELIRIESIIADLLNLSWENSVWHCLPPTEKPKQQIQAFCQFIRLLCMKDRIVIHLDDPQWIDSLSLEYLQSIANEPIDNIVILASCRYLESGEMIDLKIPFTCIDHIALPLN